MIRWPNWRNSHARGLRHARGVAVEWVPLRVRPQLGSSGRDSRSSNPRLGRFEPLALCREGRGANGGRFQGGGHLASRAGRLILRESAQCPGRDRRAFQDVERHPFFNTNNLWLALGAPRAIARQPSPFRSFATRSPSRQRIPTAPAVSNSRRRWGRRSNVSRGPRPFACPAIDLHW
ncbi:MAG: hypothetical protein GY910_04625 [bacterium]|nr:hypothetical protein [bacterium]